MELEILNRRWLLITTTRRGCAPKLSHLDIIRDTGLGSPRHLGIFPSRGIIVTRNKSEVGERRAGPYRDIGIIANRGTVRVSPECVCGDDALG